MILAYYVDLISLFAHAVTIINFFIIIKILIYKIYCFVVYLALIHVILCYCKNIAKNNHIKYISRYIHEYWDIKACSMFNICIYAHQSHYNVIEA